MTRKKLDLTKKPPTPPAPRTSRPSGGNFWPYGWLITGIVAIAILVWWLWPQNPAPASAPFTTTSQPFATTTKPTNTRTGVITATTSLAKLLTELDIPERARKQLLSDPTIQGIDTVYSGHRYELQYREAGQRTLRSLAYEVDEETYVTLTVHPYARVNLDRRPTSYRERAYAGLITENIWHDILESRDLHHTIIPLLEEATKFTVDIFHLNPGDRYELAFTERVRGEEILGVQTLNSVIIKKLDEGGRAYQVFRWDNGKTDLYVNADGHSVRSRYLKAPVKFSIISSPYSKSRRHPVTGVLQPHKGIDYAAPEGAPIYALADGAIEKARYEKNNGNNVRIIHDRRYKTQYLHMSEIAVGIRPGAKVKQGQVIGYVGQTGLATGPHVCLRFWEDQRQVNFLANSYTTKKRLPPGELDRFWRYRDSISSVLEEMEAVF